MEHQVGTQVERAYRRTDVLDKRRQLMEAWAQWCEPNAARRDYVEPFAISSKPYDFTPIAPGIGLGYRRNRTGPGSWVPRLADGKSGYRTSNIGLAHDLQDADGDQVSTWFEAVERGRKLAKGDAPEAGGAWDQGRKEEGL